MGRNGVRRGQVLTMLNHIRIYEDILDLYFSHMGPKFLLTLFRSHIHFSYNKVYFFFCSVRHHWAYDHL